MNNYAIWMNRKMDMIIGAIIGVVLGVIATCIYIAEVSSGIGQEILAGIVCPVLGVWLASTIVSVFRAGGTSAGMLVNLMQNLLYSIPESFLGLGVLFTNPLLGMFMLVGFFLKVMLILGVLAVLVLVKAIAFPIETIIMFKKRNC